MRRKFFPFIAFMLLSRYISAQAIGDYQTAGSGNWNVAGTWQTWSGAAWIAAGAAPTSANGVITILATHTVTITANVTIDQVVVNGTLTSNGASPTTIAAGAGVDLLINGTFADNYAAATNVITWNAGATWQMGATGTLLKTSASSSNNWQSNYQGGIATIPATAFWIIRRNTAVSIPFSSTTPASGSVYPNLTIENNVAGTWSTPAGSSITGSTAFVTIKGNFDVGGTGTTFVDFSNNNTNASPTLVQGNVTIRTGNILRNYGAGLEVQGNLIVNGTVNYAAGAGVRNLVFSGANAQAVSGTGTLNVYKMTLNKSANGLTLNRAITVDNLSTFTWGIMYTTAVNLLSIASTGTVTGANNNSFVSGPVRYYGNAAFVYPVGKNSDYQAIATSAYAASSPFWTENFNNGCVSGCLANTYVGPNGAWTVASTGTCDADANVFFISCAENGNAVGACGTGCGGDATLHIGNVSTSPAAFFFCPTGDCGAAYDAGLATNNVRASWRAESPTINCTGYSNFNLSFRYMENGATTLDNATVWYYDGAVWAQLADMAKTATTCGAGQGLWTAYSIAMPASAYNNPNVKVGFQWVNNDDGAGTDPSFAVDGVSLGMTDYFTAEYFYANPQVAYNNLLAPTLVSISACEYWILDRAAGSNASTSVTLTWDGNSCPAIPQVSDTRVAHFDLGGTNIWQDEGNAATTGTTAAGTVTSGAAVTYFSPFTHALIPNPLPIELLSFNGICDNDQIELSWSTATEKDNHYFTIERSSDGTNFSEISRIPGAGNSEHKIDYAFVDDNAFSGINYYRLIQTDYNGRTENFSPITVDRTNCNGHEFQIENSQFDEQSLSGQFIDAEGTILLRVFASNGQLIYTSTVDKGDVKFSIPSQNWPPGLYFINASDGYSVVSRSVLK